MKKRNLRGGLGKKVPPIERFWLQVRKTRGCWYWEGNLGMGNYGRIVVGGQKIKAHRYSWTIHNGHIPEGLFVCHHCDNPRCVKPAHLFVGDNRSNRADSVRKKRHNSGYSVGELCHFSKVTDEQVKYVRRVYQRGSKGRYSAKSLAKEVGVCTNYMREILKGNSRKHESGVLRIRQTSASNLPR